MGRSPCKTCALQENDGLSPPTPLRRLGSDAQERHPDSFSLFSASFWPAFVFAKPQNTEANIDLPSGSRTVMSGLASDNWLAVKKTNTTAGLAEERDTFWNFLPRRQLSLQHMSDQVCGCHIDAAGVRTISTVP